MMKINICLASAKDIVLTLPVLYLDSMLSVMGIPLELEIYASLSLPFVDEYKF